MSRDKSAKVYKPLFLTKKKVPSAAKAQVHDVTRGGTLEEGKSPRIRFVLPLTTFFAAIS